MCSTFIISFNWHQLKQRLVIFLSLRFYLAYVYVCVYHSPWSRGSHTELVITSHYPPTEGLKLITGWLMSKAVTFHTSHTPSSCSRRAVTAWLSVKTLHLERGTNPSLPSDRLRCYHRATKLWQLLLSSRWHCYWLCTWKINSIDDSVHSGWYYHPVCIKHISQCKPR